MKMKKMTIVIKYEDDQKIEPITFDDNLLGGRVVGLAAYDLMTSLEIAEEGLSSSDDWECKEAITKMDNVVREALGLAKQQ